MKGVYPREPSKKVKGRDKTYYYTKDIMFLMHDPVLSKLREQKTWRKRIAKAKGRKQAVAEIRRIEKQKPKYSLIPIVKERYFIFFYFFNIFIFFNIKIQLDTHHLLTHYVILMIHYV